MAHEDEGTSWWDIRCHKHMHEHLHTHTPQRLLCEKKTKKHARHDAAWNFFFSPRRGPWIKRDWDALRFRQIWSHTNSDSWLYRTEPLQGLSTLVAQIASASRVYNMSTLMTWCLTEQKKGILGVFCDQDSGPPAGELFFWCVFVCVCVCVCVYMRACSCRYMHSCCACINTCLGLYLFCGFLDQGWGLRAGRPLFGYVCCVWMCVNVCGRIRFCFVRICMHILMICVRVCIFVSMYVKCLSLS